MKLSAEAKAEADNPYLDLDYYTEFPKLPGKHNISCFELLDWWDKILENKRTRCVELTNVETYFISPRTSRLRPSLDGTIEQHTQHTQWMTKKTFFKTDISFFIAHTLYKNFVTIFQIPLFWLLWGYPVSRGPIFSRKNKGTSARSKRYSVIILPLFRVIVSLQT